MNCKSILKGMAFSLVCGVLCFAVMGLTPLLANAESVEADKPDQYAVSIGTPIELYEFLMRVDDEELAGVAWNVTLTADIEGIEAPQWGVVTSDPRRNGNAFVGTFDGAGNSITLGYFPLFNQVGDGTTQTTIKNLTTQGTIMGTGEYTGAIAQHADNVTLTNCSNEAFVEGSSYYTGALIGRADGGKLERCSNQGEVGGTDAIGGLVGFAEGVSLTECYNIAMVSAGSGNAVAGGLVGISVSETSLTNCYNLGAVHAVNSAGGLIGRYDAGAKISSSYNLGDVTAETAAGGIAGAAVNEAAITLDGVYTAAVVQEGTIYDSRAIGSGTMGSDTAYVIDVVDAGVSTGDQSEVVTLAELDEIFGALPGWSVTAGLYPLLSYQAADPRANLYSVPAMVIDGYLVKSYRTGYPWSGSTIQVGADENIVRVLHTEMAGAPARRFVVQGSTAYAHQPNQAYVMPVGMQKVRTVAGESDGCSYNLDSFYYVSDNAEYQYTA